MSDGYPDGCTQRHHDEAFADDDDDTQPDDNAEDEAWLRYREEHA
jgi:hypothetical protein